MLLRMVGARGKTSQGMNGYSLSPLHVTLINKTATAPPRETVSNSIGFSLMQD